MQSPSASSRRLFRNLVALCISLVTLFFLDACTNERPFSSRRYLPGIFHPSHPEQRNSDLREKTTGETNGNEIVPAPEISVSISDTSRKTGESLSTSPANAKAGIKHDPSAAPPDTTEPAPRKKWRWKYLDEKQKVDRTLGYGIYTLISGMLFFLLGLLLAKGGNQFTNDIVSLLVLILLIIPLFFAAAATALLSSILELLSAKRLRSENNNTTNYEGHSKVKLAGIFVLLGLIFTVLSAIFFLPHFLDW